MRIIAGRLRGRVVNSPHSRRTHPMSEKVRGALFNALGDIDGLTVLDAFAGSGALGFEAISRGATHATLLDIDKLAITAAVKSAAALGLSDKVKITRASASAWLITVTDMFDLVLADPPYDDLQLPALQKLTGRVNPNGLFVLSWPGGQTVPEFAGLELVDHKSYGDAELAFYRRIG